MSEVSDERRTYGVLGMSCGHCERSILEEVSRVVGVDAVEADLAIGRLTVSGGSIDDAAVRAAVAAAGYEVAA